MTLRLHKATLRHYMALPEQSWHSQVNRRGLGSRFGSGGRVKGVEAGEGNQLGWG